MNVGDKLQLLPSRCLRHCIPKNGLNWVPCYCYVRGIFKKKNQEKQHFPKTNNKTRETKSKARHAAHWSPTVLDVSHKERKIFEMSLTCVPVLLISLFFCALVSCSFLPFFLASEAIAVTSGSLDVNVCSTRWSTVIISKQIQTLAICSTSKVLKENKGNECYFWDSDMCGENNFKVCFLGLGNVITEIYRTQGTCVVEKM